MLASVTNMTQQSCFDGTVEVLKEGDSEVNGKFVEVSAERDPENDWLG